MEGYTGNFKAMEYSEVQDTPRSHMILLATAKHTESFVWGALTFWHRTAGWKPAGSCAIVFNSDAWIVGRIEKRTGSVHSQAFSTIEEAKQRYLSIAAGA